MALGLNVCLVLAYWKTSTLKNGWHIWLGFLYFFLLPADVGLVGRIILQFALFSGLMFIFLSRFWATKKIA